VMAQAMMHRESTLWMLGGSGKGTIVRNEHETAMPGTICMSATRKLEGYTVGTLQLHCPLQTLCQLGLCKKQKISIVDMNLCSLSPGSRVNNHESELEYKHY
jgi:hypothetical protein